MFVPCSQVQEEVKIFTCLHVLKHLLKASDKHKKYIPKPQTTNHNLYNLYSEWLFVLQWQNNILQRALRYPLI